MISGRRNWDAELEAARSDLVSGVMSLPLGSVPLVSQILSANDRAAVAMLGSQGFVAAAYYLDHRTRLYRATEMAAGSLVAVTIVPG